MNQTNVIKLTSVDDPAVIGVFEILSQDFKNGVYKIQDSETLQVGKLFLQSRKIVCRNNKGQFVSVKVNF